MNNQREGDRSIYVGNPADIEDKTLRNKRSAQADHLYRLLFPGGVSEEKVPLSSAAIIFATLCDEQPKLAELFLKAVAAAHTADEETRQKKEIEVSLAPEIWRTFNAFVGKSDNLVAILNLYEKVFPEIKIDRFHNTTIPTMSGFIYPVLIHLSRLIIERHTATYLMLQSRDSKLVSKIQEFINSSLPNVILNHEAEDTGRDLIVLAIKEFKRLASVTEEQKRDVFCLLARMIFFKMERQPQLRKIGFSIQDLSLDMRWFLEDEHAIYANYQKNNNNFDGVIGNFYLSSKLELLLEYIWAKVPFVVEEAKKCWGDETVKMLLKIKEEIHQKPEFSPDLSIKLNF